MFDYRTSNVFSTDCSVPRKSVGGRVAGVDESTARMRYRRCSFLGGGVRHVDETRWQAVHNVADGDHLPVVVGTTSVLVLSHFDSTDRPRHASGDHAQVDPTADLDHFSLPFPLHDDLATTADDPSPAGHDVLASWTPIDHRRQEPCGLDRSVDDAGCRLEHHAHVVVDHRYFRRHHGWGDVQPPRLALRHPPTNRNG